MFLVQRKLTNDKHEDNQKWGEQTTKDRRKEKLAFAGLS
jgi:hypothetical protein